MGRDVMGALAMDSEKFHAWAWGLPCMGFITMQRSLKKVTTALGSATGLRGKLLESAPIQSSKVVGLSEMITDIAETPADQRGSLRLPALDRIKLCAGDV
eukprot:g17636.t1